MLEKHDYNSDPLMKFVAKTAETRGSNTTPSRDGQPATNEQVAQVIAAATHKADSENPEVRGILERIRPEAALFLLTFAGGITVLANTEPGQKVIRALLGK